MANRRVLLKYKGDRCASCGKTVEEVIARRGTFHRMFEFNHVDASKKHPNYENVIGRALSTEQLDEVDKCVLLCDHCHNIVHAQNMTAEVSIAVKVGNKRAEQRLKGQLVIDKVDGKGTFLTNERLLVFPYRVSLGARRPRVLFGMELEKDFLITHLKRIAEYKTIVVRSWNRTEVMRAQYLSGDTFILTHDVRCPFFTCELYEDKDKSIAVWLRNGIGITKDEVLPQGTVTYEMKLPA